MNYVYDNKGTRVCVHNQVVLVVLSAAWAISCSTVIHRYTRVNYTLYDTHVTCVYAAVQRRQTERTYLGRPSWPAECVCVAAQM